MRPTFVLATMSTNPSRTIHFRGLAKLISRYNEPTAGLDPNQIHEVRETIRKLGQSKTILLSTHILQEVEAMASRVLFINEGRLVYDGSIKDLTKDGKPLDQHFRELTAA